MSKVERSVSTTSPPRTANEQLQRLAANHALRFRSRDTQGLTGLAVTFKRTNLDVMTLGAAGRSQPRRSQLTIGPRGLRQLAIPLLPQITELPYLVRALGGTIPRFADIVREIVETGVREIA